MRYTIALLLVPLASSQDLFLNKFPPAPSPSPSEGPEVIVVGAGWSGMSAAHQLALHNVSFIVLEARNYTGGRTHAIQFGDPKVYQMTAEIGSGWLESSGKSGGPEHSPPPVWTYAQQHGLKVAFVPGSTQNQSNYKHIYAADGTDCDPDGSIRIAANKALDCIGKRSGKGKDVTVRKALTDCGWVPKTACERAVDWGITVDDPGMVPETQSLSLTLPDQVYEWWGPDDHYVVDQRPRGYAGVMDEMLKDTIPEGDKRLIFNTKVTQVAYDTDGVTISTEGGKTYKAKTAITTFPLGVLTRHHKTLFKPNIPKKVSKILEGGKYVMSNLTRIYIQFPTVFWDNEDEAFLAASNGNRGEFPEFRNENHATRVPGSKTLLAFVGNPESMKYEAMSDAEVQAAVVKKLKELFGADKVPEPSAFYMTRWGLDPLAYGCYSGEDMGFDDDWFGKLHQVLKDSSGTARVYWAGEHTCDDLSGSVYGGYQSGRQWTLKYLHATGRVSKAPTDLCWA